MTITDLPAPPASPEVAPAPAPSPAPRSARPSIDVSKLRMPATILAGVVVLLVVLHGVLGPLLHSQAQQHLTDEVVQPTPNIGSGEALGVVQAASIELNEVFVEGIADSSLRRAPGHHPSSALPGTDGTAVLVGRRSQFGGPFAKVNKLKAGDQIVVQLRGGTTTVAFDVREVVTVAASELDATIARAGASSLALVTSGGGLLGGDRVVVLASLVGTGAPAGETATIHFSDVRGTELVMWLVWAGAAVVLGVFGRRALAGRSRVAVLAVLVPLVTLVVLQLWLTTSALLPMTY